MCACVSHMDDDDDDDVVVVVRDASNLSLSYVRCGSVQCRMVEIRIRTSFGVSTTITIMKDRSRQSSVIVLQLHSRILKYKTKELSCIDAHAYRNLSLSLVFLVSYRSLGQFSVLLHYSHNHHHPDTSISSIKRTRITIALTQNQVHNEMVIVVNVYTCTVPSRERNLSLSLSLVSTSKFGFHCLRVKSAEGRGIQK